MAPRPPRRHGGAALADHDRIRALPCRSSPARDPRHQIGRGQRATGMSSVARRRRNSPGEPRLERGLQRGPFGVDGGEPRRVAVAPLHHRRLPEHALVGQAQPLRRPAGRQRSARRTSTRSGDTRPRRPISSSGTSPRSPRRCAASRGEKESSRPRWTRRRARSGGSCRTPPRLPPGVKVKNSGSSEFSTRAIQSQVCLGLEGAVGHVVPHRVRAGTPRRALGASAPATAGRP
jgi:hypothetical protein